MLITSSLPGERSPPFRSRRGDRRALRSEGRHHRRRSASPDDPSPGRRLPKPGLMDWLLRRVSFDDILQRHAVGGVDVSRPASTLTIPPNLLSSERVQAAVARLSEQYHLVVIDSAPVLALSDTRVLSMLRTRRSSSFAGPRPPIASPPRRCSRSLTAAATSRARC